MSPNSDSHDPDLKAGSGGNLKIIDLEFETLRQFREVMAPRLNYEGFFVATTDPLPKGTPARFRFLLPDGFVLVEGTAVVAWTRIEGDEPELRPGMALLFNELEHQSREIIDELIDFHIATGGDPFEIGPSVGEAGDIGTDALVADAPGTEPMRDSGPEPDATGPKASTSEDFLPDWLSEVAQKHDVDLSADGTVPVGETREEVQIPESHEPTQQDFEISLMPEDEEEEPDLTPVYPDIADAPEVTVPAAEPHRAPRGSRKKPVLAVVAVVAVVAAAATIVWWLANRGPGEALPEPPVIIEEIPRSEPPTEVVEDQTEDVSGKPAEVFEPEPDSSQVEEEAGPATRILLVAATRVGDETVVTVRANGELSPDSVRVSLLKDPARVWVRIQGIETFYRPNDIEVGTPEVDRVRVGHHPEETPQSIYVVFDLEDSAAVVREHTVEGDTLRVVVGRP